MVRERGCGVTCSSSFFCRALSALASAMILLCPLVVQQLLALVQLLPSTRDLCIYSDSPSRAPDESSLHYSSPAHAPASHSVSVPCIMGSGSGSYFGGYLFLELVNLVGHDL